MSYEATVREINVVEGVEVDITVRDTGSGESKPEKVLTELKTHLGRIATAYDEEKDPVDVDLKTEYMPLAVVNWESVFDNE